MPQRIWLSLTAWLYDRTSVSCGALAEALETVSHARVTRMWQADWSGHTRLELACRTLCVWARGYLMIDDPVIPKPCATAIEGLAWVFSSPERKSVYGLSRVLLVWTHGTRRLPLGIRLWHQGGASKSARALERLSDARQRLRGPQPLSSSRPGTRPRRCARGFATLGGPGSVGSRRTAGSTTNRCGPTAAIPTGRSVAG